MRLIKQLFIFILLFIAINNTLYAKSMKDLWLTMPDSIIPYLNANDRLQFIDYNDLHVQATVTNKLQGECKMDTLTSNYVHVSLTPCSSIEMRLLPYANNDSILCVVKTYGDENKESQIYFYDQNWTLLPINVAQISSPSVTESKLTSFTNDSTYISDPVMIWMSLDINDDILVIHRSVTMVTNTEKKDINTNLLQTTIKWNGKTFN
ncbi:hypothetical protein C3V39_10030 [Prevotella sp. oral taxon 820]|nr:MULTISPECIES: DUF3256 family protein [Prevotella]PTL25053.1 hypothetical protein C3V39_10030 [Prevotella sp. oral taxon 820]